LYFCGIQFGNQCVARWKITMRAVERASERASSRVTQSPSIRGTETRDGHCDHLSFIELHNLFVEFVISIVMYESLALRTTVSYHQYNLGIIQFTLVATDSRYRGWVRMTDQHGHLGLAILRTRVQYTADIHIHLHALYTYVHTYILMGDSLPDKRLRKNLWKHDTI